MAISKTFRRADSKTTWVVEFYPFNHPDPQDDMAAGGIGSLDSAVSVISSGSGAVTDLVEQLKVGGLKNGVEVQRGLVGLQIRRSKVRADGTCNFTFVGPVPKSVIAGTWVVVSSVTTDVDGSRRTLIRFIGQIHSPETNYMIQPSGNLALVTQVPAREWSAMLNMPVRFDLGSIFNIMAGTSAGAAVLTSVLGALPGGVTNKNLEEMISNSYNPFEFAHLILALIGGINQSETLDKIKALKIEGLAESAMTMPSIPMKLLKRLGLQDVNPQNPFTSGFVEVLTGVQTGPVMNDGTWDGIFGAGISLSGYKNGLSKSPDDRPVSFGISAIAQTNLSAWEMLSAHCDPSVNECFTDIFYGKKADPETGETVIFAKPVIVFRDKPFLMKRFEGQAALGTSFSNWTKYDDLPRVRLDNAYILGFKVGHTLLNSPNLIRVNYHSSIGSPDIDKLLSQKDGIERLGPQMRRWGGQEFYIETTFLGVDTFKGENKDFDWKGWIATIKDVGKFWHSYNYRMGHGTIIMKDNGSAISCGFNAQFTFGNVEVVGHVEAVGIDFRIDERGVEETTLQIELARIVSAGKNQLELFEMSDFGNLHNAKPPTEMSDSASLTEGIDSAVGAASEFFKV